MSGNVMIDPQISEARRGEVKPEAPSLKMVDTFASEETLPLSARVVERTENTIVLKFDQPKVRRTRSTTRSNYRGPNNIIFDTAIVFVMSLSAAASVVALLTMGKF